MKDYKAVIKNKNFLYLWTSQLLSQQTVNIINFIFLIKLFSETGSTIATSLLWISYALPAVVIGPIASAFVDMVERRKILIITNLLQAMTILVYALFFRGNLFMIFGIAIIYSFLNQFYVPAEAASLPTVVKKENYPTANGLFFLTQQTAIITGFAFAGLINKLLGFELSLILCSVFLFSAFISVLFLPKLAVHDTLPKKFDEALFKFFSRIYEGYMYIKSNKIVWAPFVILMSLQAILSVVVVNVPLLTVEIFKQSADLAGIVVVVPAGIGAALAAMTIPKMIKRGKKKKSMIDNAFAALTMALFIVTFIISELPDILTIIIGGLSVVVMGFSFVTILIPSQTILQENTPTEYRGRVFGNFWFLVTIITIFPVLFSGAISEIFGIRLMMFILTGITLSALVYSKRKGGKLFANGK